MDDANTTLPAALPDDDAACADCVLTRRGFVTLAAGLAAALGLEPTPALALAVRTGRALATSAATVTYAVPSRDGATVDSANQVILVRWQQRLYAFSSRCPHKQAFVQWFPSVQQFICPKHKAHYNPVGAHVSGRSTRSMDRHPLQRVGATVVVNTAITYQSDTSAAQWSAATIPV